MIGISYYALYLKSYLSENGDDRATDNSFIEERADYAALEYENRRLSGSTVDEAQESAMAVLMEGLV